MPKILKAVDSDMCIGCEMCVMECQRQLQRVGLEGSYIRILRNIKKGTRFEISIDPNISKIKYNRIVSICPKGVFEEVEES